MHGAPGCSPTHPPESSGNVDERWAEGLLRSCAKAIADNDSGEIRRHLWLLNELSSPYGDVEQKLAHHFLQALFCRATGAGGHRLSTFGQSFESARRVVLRFQELSPWMTFGHVASNGAILEAMEGDSRLHIIDIGGCNTYCTQYPTLLESLATRAGVDAPHVRLTAVVTAAAMEATMAEVGRRMERFARLMGVPLEFDVVVGLEELVDVCDVRREEKKEEAVAVSCSGKLRWVDPCERDAFLGTIRGLRPRVVTVVEEEADHTSRSDDFLLCFDECLRFYSSYFDVIEQCFDRTSDERVVLERECSRSIFTVLAGGGGERRETGAQWCRRMMVAAFSPAGFSQDVVADVDALLKRYQAARWSTVPPAAGSGLYLAWKNEPVVWASAWKL